MPRGRSHLSDCIDPSSGYEVVNEDLKKVIYHILGFNENIPVVVPITAPIIFIAKAALSRQIGTQLSILGVKTVVTNFKDAGLKVTIGTLAGIAVAVFANPAAFIGGGLLVAAFGLNIYFGELKCENSHLRDKFHHAPDLDSPIPPTLGIQELNRLSNSNLYEERLKVFRNREILPETYVEQLGRDLRFAVLSPDTTIKKGTFGANLEAAGVSKKIPGYIAYNEETGFCAFFEENGGLYKTSFIANRGQRIDIKKNSNLM